MTTVTTDRSADRFTDRSGAVGSALSVDVAASVEELTSLLATVGDSVACIDVDDERWHVAGPTLTAAVDAARRAIGEAGSAIGPHDAVAPALRLRDLARVGERVVGRSGDRIAGTAVAEVARHVRSLQMLAGR